MLKWPDPNLLENIKMFKTHKKRPLVYLDQNILSEMAKGKDYVQELHKVLLEYVSKGLLACPENILRRIESTEIPEHWSKIDSIMSCLSFGISFNEWADSVLCELNESKNKIQAIISNNMTNNPFSYHVYLNSVNFNLKIPKSCN